MTVVLPLLIELGTEELPPKALDELALAFRDGVTAGFEKRGVAFEAGSVRAYWTPRRLALLIGAIEAQQPDQDTERRGPALAAGFDAQGKPSKALIGFAQSCGVDGTPTDIGAASAATERSRAGPSGLTVRSRLRPWTDSFSRSATVSRASSKVPSTPSARRCVAS